MEKYIKMLIDEGAQSAVKVDVKNIITAAWVVYKCKYGCGGYNKSRCCPPNSPTYKETQEIIDCYKYGILFKCDDYTKPNQMALKMAEILFFDNYYKAIAFGCGPCRKCENCNIEECNFPKEAIPAMEASGIDVFATARANGFEINTLSSREETQNCFGLILVE